MRKNFSLNWKSKEAHEFFSQEEKKHACKICNKIFSQTGNLKKIIYSQGEKMHAWD